MILMLVILMLFDFRNFIPLTNVCLACAILQTEVGIGYTLQGYGKYVLRKHVLSRYLARQYLVVLLHVISLCGRP